MSDEENFLERWSRRKAEAKREAVEPPAAGEAGPVSAGVATDAPQADGPERQAPAAEPDKPAFDLASLPPLDSITAATDIRAFLKPGVPADLARAALRRAWVADPAIRDFRGLQENDWDFTDPDSVPGFGRLVPDADIKKMIAQMFGPAEPEAGETAKAAGNEPEAAPTPTSHEVPPAEVTAEASDDAGPATPEPAMVQRESIVALQDELPQVECRQPPLPRRHGGALPK